MTVHLNPLSWFRKPKRDLELEMARARAESAEKQLVANFQSREPLRRHHPCEHPGHEFHPLHKTAKELMLVCVRCAEVKRLPLKSPSVPAPQSRWTPASLV